MRLTSPVCLALACLAATACVENDKPKVDTAYVQQNILSAEPTPNHPVNADLGGKVVYLGADIDKTTLRPGDKFTVVHYWKVIQPPGGEWKIFTHLVGGTREDWMNVDATKMRTNHGPATWKAGEIVRDEQTITLKGTNGTWSSPTATLMVGLYPKGRGGERDRMPVVSGPSDGKSAVIVARIPVTVAPRAVTPPSIVRKASGPITIDGKADEPDWSKALATGAFQDAEGGPAVGQGTTARLLWDDQNLYVFADLDDKDVFSQYRNDDDPLWKEDVIEMFVDADGSGRGYVELQVNPNNAHFDAWFAGTRADGPGDVSYASGMKSAVVVDGTADKRGDADKAWHVEIAIPLAAVKGKDAAMAVTIPPKPGDRWKLNLVRVEGQGSGKIAASSWGRITIRDFHALDRLMTVVFGDTEGNAAAPGPASAPAVQEQAAAGVGAPPGALLRKTTMGVKPLSVPNDKIKLHKSTAAPR